MGRRTQTTLTDGGFETDDSEGEDEDTTFDPEEETVTDDWEGVYLYTSWGYGQTNVEMAQIVDVSDSGKTVLARRVTANRVDGERGSDSMRPNADQFGDEFRLHVRTSRDDPVFRGSYPYIDGEMDTGTRRGSFSVFDNEPGKTVHKTAPNYGH